MGKRTEMDKDAAARIQSARARNFDSDTAASGFDSSAQSAAARHEADGGQSGGARGQSVDLDEDEEKTLEEIEARERWAEATEGHRLTAHYGLPMEVLEAIEVTEMDTYE
ncbi:hypothetical protein NE857_02030 [Nocardiopsis exhalans]|uniref:Uncharacterized protein n=1 Tax=Nocardiopsis exhalans TaxID=163604 RepID=A0ABY5DAF7_9ACTN|nr:hypothetical protein [Nocardiopsis exhalans]USY20463.1 hypothetical protein NE857_02030 [Nocardiopsis exhalans]